MGKRWAAMGRDVQEICGDGQEMGRDGQENVTLAMWHLPSLSLSLSLSKFKFKFKFK